VGDTPVSKMVMEKKSIKGMVGHEAEIDKDLLPPKYLFIHKAKEEKKQYGGANPEDEKSIERLRLSLGLMSPVIKTKTKGSLLRLSASESLSAEEKPYSNIVLPAGSKESLIVLYKQINHKKWNKPQTIVLPNDRQFFPPQTLRMINASSLPVSVKIKTKIYEFKPGEVKSVKLAVNEQVRFMAVLKNKTKMIKISNTSIKLGANQRMNVVFHNRMSDVKRPIRVMKLPENIVTEPKPVVE